MCLCGILKGDLACLDLGKEVVCLCLIGNEDVAGYDTVSGKASVDAETGANYFCKDENGPHRYVIPKFDKDYYSAAIDALL